MDLDKIGKFITKLRKEKGLKQETFAEQVGVTSYKTVSNWERGTCFPDLAYQQKICEILDITLEELHSGEYNIEKRRRHKRNKIINTVMIIYATVAIPILIFLCTFFICNYDATKIYKIKTVDSTVETIVNGMLTETKKHKILYIGSVDLNNYKVVDTDIIKVKIFNNNDLLFQSNSLTSMIIKLDDKVKTDNLKMIIEIKNKDSVIYESVVKLNTVNITDEYNKMDKIKDSKITLLSEDKIIENLEKNGFSKETKTKDANSWVKNINKSKNKSQRIMYYLKQYYLNYVSLDNEIYQTIDLNMKTGIMEVNIFYMKEEINTLVEKYTYNYETDELSCKEGSCSSLVKVKKTLEPYITLITSE